MRVLWTVLSSFLILCGTAEYGAVLCAAPADVTITVQDDSGSAIAGVRISARLEKRHSPDFANPATVARGDTTADGSVRLVGLDPKKTYTLVATAPDAQWKKYHDRCLVDWSPKDTTVTLAPPRPVNGVVKDPAGKAVPFATVFLSIGRWESATIADKNGTYRFPNAPPGRGAVRAQVERKGGSPVTGQIISFSPTDKSTDARLPAVPSDRQAYLIVRVTTPHGRPVMQGNASFRGARRGFGSSFTSGSSLEGGAARTSDFGKAVTMEVLGARSEYGEPLPCGPGKGGPYGPGPREATLQLPVELFIDGRVLGPKKKPLVGIRVQAVSKSSSFGVWMGTSHGDGVSGKDGRFRIGGLDDREYALRCVETEETVGGEGAAKGGTKDVDLVTRAAAKPTLTFKDESGAPVARAIIRVKPPETNAWRGITEDERTRELRTDAKGQVRITGLDPQVKYLLTAFPPTTRGELLNWEIPGWVPKDTALTFEVARRITGVIRDQDKRVVPQARVEWVRLAGSSDAKAKPKQVAAGDDGRFVMEKLRPGKYRLLAMRPAVKRTGVGPAPKERRDVSKPTVVNAGKEDLSLKVAMPGSITFRVWGWDKGLGKPTVLFAAEGNENIGPASVTKSLDKDGTVVVKGLRWDVKYSIWMGGLRKGKYVYEAGVHPQDEKVSTTVKDGATVLGKIVSPKGTKARKVWAVFPGFKVSGKIKSGGRFEIGGLPPGPWTLHGCGKLGKELIEADVTCKPGDDAVITLEAKK